VMKQIMFYLIIVFITSCEGPEDGNVSPESSVKINIGYLDESIVGIDNAISDEVFDKEGFYRNPVSVNNRSWLEGKDLFIIPIRLDRKVKKLLLEYQIDGKTVIKNKFIAGNAYEYNLHFNFNNIPVDILSLDDKNVNSILLKAEDEYGSTTERKLNFFFSPIFSGEIFLEIDALEEYEVQGMPERFEFKLKGGFGHKEEIKLKYNCGVSILGKKYNKNVSKIIVEGGMAHGNGSYTWRISVDEDHIFIQKPLYTVIEYDLYPCNTSSKVSFINQKIKIEGLKCKENKSFRLNKPTPSRKSRVYIQRVNVFPDEYFEDYLGWKVNLKKEVIDFFIN